MVLVRKEGKKVKRCKKVGKRAKTKEGEKEEWRGREGIMKHAREG